MSAPTPGTGSSGPRSGAGGLVNVAEAYGLCLAAGLGFWALAEARFRLDLFPHVAQAPLAIGWLLGTGGLAVALALRGQYVAWSAGFESPTRTGRATVLSWTIAVASTALALPALFLGCAVLLVGFTFAGWW